MLKIIQEFEQKYAELESQLLESQTDYQKTIELNKERSDLEPIIHKVRVLKNLYDQAASAKNLLATEKDPEMLDLVKSELDQFDLAIPEAEDELRLLLIPKDPRDDKNVFVEIRAGTGGDEAALFAADLFRMYSRYAERKGWKMEVVNLSEIGIGGIKEAVFQIKGKRAYSRLKWESGVHRVQRVPATESQGRVHTSAATVAVLAEVDPIEISIPEKDISIDVFKSAGAGGQNVQKNSTAVRLTHHPTGIVVTCQDERSQLQNKERALSILRARLYENQERERQEELIKTKKDMVRSGDRSDKIRTYNYPQSRVTDHRINVSSYNLPVVMDGEIDLFIDELTTRDEAEKLTSSTDFD
ncbi:MAG TPA: peptide chain release factor 1 [Anaerolineales bacterium]|nr:peptide chain release factor 1 [Anaerolineales bacterium]